MSMALHVRASAAENGYLFCMAKYGAKKARASGLLRRWWTLTAVNLHHQGHDQERHNVDDFDQGIDGRASGVLVGVTHRVAGDRCLVGLRALAAVVAVF